MIAAMWWWLATPITLARAPIDPKAKLQCVSYAPFRGAQTPLVPTTHISAEQIAQDLAQLAKITDCVRTYSIENGLDQVPALAAKVGLKVIQGIWLSSNRLKNLSQISTAVGLTKEFPGVITALVVGNEVLLRGEMAAADLAANIRAVKSQVTVPVTYADVWEFWLRNREVYDAVDFVTIHILPYWEDIPVRAKYAAGHVDDIRRRMAVAFPGKEILIGETGWPSTGRMREGALPSRTNQARVVSEILTLAKREEFRVNLIEAYDQPWKRQLEGTVGGYWGLFDSAQARAEISARRADQQFPALEVADGMRDGAQLPGLSGGMADAAATAMEATADRHGSWWEHRRRRPACCSGSLPTRCTMRATAPVAGCNGGHCSLPALPRRCSCANAAIVGPAAADIPRTARARAMAGPESVLTALLGLRPGRDHADRRARPRSASPSIRATAIFHSPR